MTPLTQDVSVLSSLSSESCKELVAKLAMLIRPSSGESSSFIADVPYARSFHAKDVVYATTLPSCDKENDWKKGTQRFVWREMSPEVREVCETLLRHASLLARLEQQKRLLFLTRTLHSHLHDTQSVVEVVLVALGKRTVILHHHAPLQTTDHSSLLPNQVLFLTPPRHINVLVVQTQK